MNHVIKKSFFALPLGAALCMLGHRAHANGIPGTAFHAQTPADIGCLSISSTGALSNTCGKILQVTSYLPNYNGNPITLTGLFGSNVTHCQAFVTNGVGNVFWSGPFAMAVNTFKVQVFGLGAPPVVAGGALVINCQIEINPTGIPGAAGQPYIGEATQ